MTQISVNTDLSFTIDLDPWTNLPTGCTSQWLNYQHTFLKPVSFLKIASLTQWNALLDYIDCDHWIIHSSFSPEVSSWVVQSVARHFSARQRGFDSWNVIKSRLLNWLLLNPDLCLVAYTCLHGISELQAEKCFWKTFNVSLNRVVGLIFCLHQLLSKGIWHGACKWVGKGVPGSSKYKSC